METQTRKPDTKTKTKAGADQSGANYFEQRLSTAAQNGQEICFPNDFQVTIEPHVFRETWTNLETGETDMSMTVQMSGRVTNKRNASKALIFLDVEGTVRLAGSSHFQILLSKKQYVGPMSSDNDGPGPVYGALQWDDIKSTINRGDVIGVVGFPHRTSRGELSILAHGIRLLGPCLHELPRDLEDRKLIDSQRYLHYIIHPEATRPILMRSLFIRTIRDFLEGNDFMEVETNILETGTGANAAPFLTHYKSINADVILRVAPELKLKLAVLAGFGRVYEIGKQFRNEGMDTTHNPEFTTCEFYWPYQTIEGLFQVTEELFGQLADVAAANGYLNSDIDWRGPYRRIDIVPELERLLGTELQPPYEGETFRQLLEYQCIKRGFQLPHPRTIAKLFDTLISELIESQCQDPTFLYGHPLIMSPLAKPEKERPHISARFEMFVQRRELCNAYSELNNPVIQRQNFLEQQIAQKAGDCETIKDEGFCLALEYGLPPTAGWGMGIDRVLMAMLKIERIGDTIMFPLSRAAIHSLRDT
jgi:lysyl-tRNA synthetase class 2